MLDKDNGIPIVTHKPYCKKCTIMTAHAEKETLYTVQRESFAGENFREFRGFGAIREVLTAKIFIEYGGVIIYGRAIVFSHNS